MLKKGIGINAVIRVVIVLCLMMSVTVQSLEVVELAYKQANLKYFSEKVVPIKEWGGRLHITNISKPSLHIFMSQKSNATRKMMIICPGGGLRVSSFENEGTKMAKMLNEHGIHAAVLKYRLAPIDLRINNINDNILPNVTESTLKITLKYAS